MQSIEVLAPAGSYEGMIGAFNAGADAVYMGAPRFGARAYADNPGLERWLSAIEYAHIHEKKLYLTVNTLLKDAEISESLYADLNPLYQAGLDAVIVQDLGVLSRIRQAFPLIDIHASTQMNVVGPAHAQWLKTQGVTRIIPARELSLAEVKLIKQSFQGEVECFVHGALCYCYSGQCLLSSMLGGRSGNRGRCAQPCRLPYQLLNAGVPVNRESEAYLLSPKDMCTLDLIPELIEAGIDSFKIEGRMKRPEYSARIAHLYRKYADRYLSVGKEGYRIDSKDRELLQERYNRSGFSQGYYQFHNDRSMVTLTKPGYQSSEKGQNSKETMWISEKKQEKIHTTLTVLKDLPVKIQLNFKGIDVTVTGEVVSQALNRPMSAEDLKKRISKTGNTPFVFEPLEIISDADAFVSVQGLNQLRRESIETLLTQYRHLFERPEGILTEELSRVKEDISNGQPLLCTTISDLQMIEILLDYPEIDIIYLESWLLKADHFLAAVESIHQANKQAYLAMPYVFRSKTDADYVKCEAKLLQMDGFLVRNIESLCYVQSLLAEHEQSKPIVSDMTLYAMNHEAIKLLHRAGVTRTTVPLELNAKELKRRGCQAEEMLIYGYIPLMVSAQCLTKTTGSCSGKPMIKELSDRYNKKFYVYNECEACYNLIYNGQALILCDRNNAALELKPASVRMNFTKETPQMIEKVLDMYLQRRSLDECGITNFTRGHYNRGVE